MRLRLFLTFFAVILTALLSNLIFEYLILRDFMEYSKGHKQDRLYWLMAAVEGAYGEGEGTAGWDRGSLEHSMHWGAILGFDLEVLEVGSGKSIINTADSLRAMSPTLGRRVDSMVKLDSATGQYEEYPLFVEGQEVGLLRARGLELRGEAMDKEQVFRQREREFLLASFLIAGGGALALSLLFSLYLTRPLKRLKAAAEDVARGNLGVRVTGGASDEVGRLIAAFNHMVESLQREETIRGHLTSNIAHELRTPLAVLRANLEALSDGVIPMDQAALDSLADEVRRLTDLVRGIEDFARAEAAFFKPTRRVELKLGEFIQSTASAMGALYSSKGMELNVEGQDAALVLDDEKLEIILRNLLTNAREHAGRGRVTITYGPLEGGRFYIQVSDEGPGIAAEAAEGIFRRFERREGSSGIGLSIARELASIMGGELTLRDGRERGAAFRLTLPSGLSG